MLQPLATRKDRSNKYIKALQNRADVYHHIGVEEKALEDLKQICATSQDVTTQLNALLQLVDINLKLGHMDEGLSYADRIKSLASRSDDPFLRGKARLVEAEVLRYQGEYETSLAMMTEALKLYTKAQTDARYNRHERRNISMSIAQCEHNIGIIYYSHGDYDPALDYFSRSAQAMKKVGEQVALIQSLNNIGLIHWRKGRLDKAEEIFANILARSQKIGHKSGVAFIIGNLGLILDARGKYDDGLRCLQQAVQYAGEIGNKSLHAIHLNNIGNMYDTLHKYREAMRYYRQSLVICQEIDYVDGIAMLFNNIGGIYCEWAQLTRALSYAVEAIKVAEKANLMETMVRCYTLKARILLYMKKYRECEEILKKAFILAKKQEMPEQIAGVMVDYVRASTIAGQDGMFDLFDMIDDAVKAAHDYLKQSDITLLSRCFVQLVLMRYNLVIGRVQGAMKQLSYVRKLTKKLDDKRTFAELAIVHAWLKGMQGKDFVPSLKDAERYARNVDSKVLAREIRDLRKYLKKLRAAGRK